ncbi:TPA: hypothetical protein N0F65_006868 [Lagenidium giganteum]|uniref:Maltase n=1 Tax=Lagenidium giganteum TaxID=4803 RepID=A0AAV2ZFF2_9STRA|nr:TPA: hypothetical protein N0F65_006868 [Lagenidium giganteum]
MEDTSRIVHVAFVLVTSIILGWNDEAAGLVHAARCSQEPGTRLDCYPPIANFPNATEELCMAQGCCWKELDNAGVPCAFDVQSVVDDSVCRMVHPASRVECRNPRFLGHDMDEEKCQLMSCCYDGDEEMCFQPFAGGYELIALNELECGWKGMLTLPDHPSGPFGNDISLLLLEVTQETSDIVRIRITDPSFPRYEVPDLPLSSEHSGCEEANYRVDFTERPFGIAISRRDTGDAIFNSTPTIERGRSFNGLVFENQYIELSTQLAVDAENASSTLYGLGERTSSLRLRTDEKGDRYPMFARGESASQRHTREGGDNLYGVHPFVLQLDDSGQAHGLFMLASNAMEVVSQREALTFRLTGGVIDLFVFVGPTADQVSEQYTKIVGRPNLPPYWSLGYHIGRVGVGSIADLELLPERMRHAGIPMDALWHDAEYADSFDSGSFPLRRMQKMIDDLHFRSQHFVVVQTPTVSTENDVRYNNTSDKQNAFERARDLDILVRSIHGENYAEKLVGSHWSAFVDFFHPNASEFVEAQLDEYHRQLPFDGIWIEMNEPSSTCDLSFAGENHTCHFSQLRRVSPHEEVTFESVSVQHAKRQTFIRSADIAFPFDPFRQPFVPGQNTKSKGGHGNLNSGTLPMATLHFGSLHYNLHSLYGHAQANMTRNALDHIFKRRSLFLSRSTFAGDGRFAGHWLGDNAATWENLRLSVSGTLQMNLFGVPFAGPAVCGYHLDASKELCVRWHQAALFFPLLLNYAHKFTTPQTPVDFDVEAANIIRQTLLQRYRYLPYMYTQFYRAHINGSCVVRPLAFEFPEDMQARAIEYQYLLGTALMVSPVVHEGAISVDAYFPKMSSWFDVESGRRFGTPGFVALLTPLQRNQVHLRGGFIIPTQVPGTTATLSRHGAYTLVAALGDSDANPAAVGELFIDDGDSLVSIEDGRYSLMKFHLFVNRSNVLTFQSKQQHVGYSGPEAKASLNAIKVYGVQGGFRGNSTITAHVKDSRNKKRRIKAEYFAHAQTLVLCELHLAVTDGFMAEVETAAKPHDEHGRHDTLSSEDADDNHGQNDVNTGTESSENGQESREPRHSKGKKRGVTALGVVGAVVGVVFLAGLIGVCFMQRRGGYNRIP